MNPTFAIPAGALRQSISIQAPSTTQNTVGEQAQEWAEVLKCRASIEALTERELFQVATFTEQVTHRIFIRDPGAATVIKAGFQVLHGQHTYKIQTISNVDERNRVLQLHCLELNPTS